ncbi:hypothetical protein ACFW2V_13340 [Streptomyces sp. NPDC058947]|uniref:hypothetical protein n=1 Tax=Streptomyces sp. NPDC058947 TaxID=3346675 RepID=UPI00369DC6E5
MTALLTPARNTNIRIESQPTAVAGVLIRIRDAAGVPSELREHAHTVVPDAPRNQWWTVGQFRTRGRDRMTWLVAKRLPGGGLAYGTEVE